MKKPKKLFNFYVSEQRFEELKIISECLELPVSILIRMGISEICKKYKDILLNHVQK